MRNEKQAPSSCLPAKLGAPMMLLANHSVADCDAHSPYLIYGSLRFHSAPSALLKPVTHLIVEFLSLHKFVLGVCGQVVGKVVTNLVQVFGLYNFVGNVLAIVVNYVFTVLRLLAYFKQVIIACAQRNQAVWEGLAQNFYTLSTGPTNTNILNKGLNR